MTVVAGCGGGVARVAPVRTAAAVGVTSTETEKNMNINYSKYRYYFSTDKCLCRLCKHNIGRKKQKLNLISVLYKRERRIRKSTAAKKKQGNATTGL